MLDIKPDLQDMGIYDILKDYPKISLTTEIISIDAVSEFSYKLNTYVILTGLSSPTLSECAEKVFTALYISRGRHEATVEEMRPVKVSNTSHQGQWAISCSFMRTIGEVNG